MTTYCQSRRQLTTGRLVGGRTYVDLETEADHVPKELFCFNPRNPTWTSRASDIGCQVGSMFIHLLLGVVVVIPRYQNGEPDSKHNGVKMTYDRKPIKSPK